MRRVSFAKKVERISSSNVSSEDNEKLNNIETGTGQIKMVDMPPYGQEMMGVMIGTGEPMNARPN